MSRSDLVVPLRNSLHWQMRVGCTAQLTNSWWRSKSLVEKRRVKESVNYKIEREKGNGMVVQLRVGFVGLDDGDAKLSRSSFELRMLRVTGAYQDNVT